MKLVMLFKNSFITQIFIRFKKIFYISSNNVLKEFYISNITVYLKKKKTNFISLIALKWIFALSLAAKITLKLNESCTDLRKERL